MYNPAIDDLIRSSYYGLEWIYCAGITDIKPTQTKNVYYAKVPDTYFSRITLVFLGDSSECTPTLVSEFARIYSLSTRIRNENFSQFRRYSEWLSRRNGRIRGFTEYDDKYYMVADRKFYHSYSRYGFCPACGILRCSPVWCICGHKELSDGWTSNNKQLDEFIKKSQLQTSSPNYAYLEWIPFNCIWSEDDSFSLHGLPTCSYVELIPLEITDDDSYYAELCDKHPDILDTDVWATVGFTYREKKYHLIKEENEFGLCLACTQQLEHPINAFCYLCKTPAPPDWTTGNKSLDSAIMESWGKVKDVSDAYIQWIEYSLLINMRQMTFLPHGCTHIAEWLDPVIDEWITVSLKRITDNRSLDVYQLIKEYPKILTPDNVWIIGITQKPSTQKYYLVFYHEIRAVLDKFIRINENVEYMWYDNFYELKEIGFGDYKTVYTAKYKNYFEVKNMEETVVLKKFKNSDQAPELFISELRNHAKCIKQYNRILLIYGATQDPKTKEYMIVMEYANNGNLLSYLGQYVYKMTWAEKLEHLLSIAWYLDAIHDAGLVHCDLHGGNIVLRDHTPKICDLALSQSVYSCKPSSTIRGILPFIAPEVFHTCKFTKKSDIYSFGIIIYLMATGELPFRDREFDRVLVCDIMGGLRPTMPDSAPEEYKKLAELCCDADPDKRPDVETLGRIIYALRQEVKNDESDDNAWNTIYCGNAIFSSEKENKYSSRLLPTGNLPKPRNNDDYFDLISLYEDNDK